MPQAAVVESAADKNITHSQQAGWMGGGMIAGAILGAVVGVAVIGLATAATIFTGGLAAPTLIPALILAGSIFTGAYMGGNLGAIHGSFQTDPKGHIRQGEAAILLNGKQAATCGSLIHCDDHGDDKRIAEGSASVFFNKLPAARVGDKGECECTIGKGVGPIYVGGGTAGCGLTVGHEVPAWLRYLHTGTGWAGAICLFAAGGLGMAVRGVAYIVPRLLLGTGVGYGVTEYGGRPVGGDIGESIDKALGGDGREGRAMGGEAGADVASIGAGVGMGKLGLFSKGPVTADRTVVTDFLKINGVPPTVQTQIRSGIDFTKPVEITTIKSGTPVEQWVGAVDAAKLSPGQQAGSGNGLGSWVTEPGTQPPDVGLTQGDRVNIPLEANQDIPVIKSTAAPIVDTWTNGQNGLPTNSVKSWSPFQMNRGTFAPGGGTQYYVPRSTTGTPADNLTVK